VTGALLDQLFRDLDRMRRMGTTPAALLRSPGAWVVATYRVGRAVRSLPRCMRAPLLVAHRPWELLLRKMTGASVPSAAEIGGGLYIARPAAVEISPEAHIGRDCNLSEGVSICSAARGPERGAPWIGDRVYIGPHARIVGPIRVGNDAAIGANAVVSEDVPDGAVIAGAPARVLSMHGSHALVVQGRRRPPLAAGLRQVVRAVLPRPTQLLLRA
jgi:serine O-acetyltransferase